MADGNSVFHYRGRRDVFFPPSGAVNILPSIEADNLWFNDKFEHIGCRTFVVHF